MSTTNLGLGHVLTETYQTHAARHVDRAASTLADLVERSECSYCAIDLDVRAVLAEVAELVDAAHGALVEQHNRYKARLEGRRPVARRAWVEELAAKNAVALEVARKHNVARARILEQLEGQEA